MDLPKVLLGPILRRVEPRAVSVFVAASESGTIGVNLYEGVVDSTAPPAVLAANQSATTRFGAAFHAAVVTVTLPEAQPLQPGHLYSYDVMVGGQSLRALGLLKDDTLAGYGTGTPAAEPVETFALGYADNRLPAFVTCPASLDELVLAHASCRKPHGRGNPGLGLIDDAIDDLHGAIAGRPHMLMLTGDQIYADDVATALLPGLTTLGFALLGDVEQIPTPSTTGGAPIKIGSFPAGFRQRAMGRAHFTSEASASHLIGFGEWLAMYCIAWNPALWPVLAVADTSQLGMPADSKAKLDADAAESPAEAPRVLGHPTPDDAPADVLTPLYAGTDPANAALAAAQRSFLEDKEVMDSYRREVPKVRRLLANVPTYMICDDHEVSDDWFMTGGIRSLTTSTPFGKTVLRNALAAYVVCQGWGDDPHAWSTEPHRVALINGISGMFGPAWAGGLPDATSVAAVETALGLAPTAAPTLDFSFTVDGPMHRLRVMDTRTRRQYDTPASGPGLLSQQAMDDQLPRETLPDGHVLVLVSPAPVFGPPIVADIGGVIGATVYDLTSMARSETAKRAEEDLTGIPTGRPTGFDFFDPEHWGANPAVYERLLNRLSQYPRVVVLAGDVHYGAAFAMDWTAPPATGSPRTSRIAHFTSSAARNGWAGVVRNLLALNGMATGLQKLGMPMTRLGWADTLPEVVSDAAAEPPLTQIRLRTGPVLLSDEMFRTSHALSRPPEWLWRAQPITDTRAPADRPPAARVPEPAGDLPGDRTAVHAYDQAVALHVQALTTAALARGLQYLDNAGLITFHTDNDGLHVSQSLYSLRARPQPNEGGDAYIVHETRLEPDPVPIPTSIGPGG